MEISIFDFDNTLVDTPYPESIEYMDQDESLDENKWTFNPKKEINKIYEELPSSNLKVLLTNRIDVVQEEVISLLEKRGITFDEHMFIKGRDGNRSKGERLRTLLKKYPETKKEKNIITRCYELSFNRRNIYNSEKTHEELD
jgi:FMN phosphatase YigB (HAD superfamily)